MSGDKIYMVITHGGHYEERWTICEGIFTTYKKAKNCRRKIKKRENLNGHTCLIIGVELNKEEIIDLDE